MARIPDGEIERLRATVNLVRLIEADGLTLKKIGKDWACVCPFHEDDNEPSLIVSPDKNLFHCFACGAAGSPIDWLMRRRGVAFRRAVELLRGMVDGEAVAPADVPKMAASKITAPLAAREDDAALLAEVIAHYHSTLQQSPEALDYLAKRGLDHAELIAHFQLGYANRTLGYRLPMKQVKSGAAIRGQLQRLGVMRESGHEHFAGSLVVPVVDGAGQISEVYGRKITSNLRVGTPLHLYLPGPHVGVFNEAGLVGHEEAILCEALLDALTFWCAGFRNVTSAYGVEGFTDEIAKAFHRHGIRRVLIAYDADEAGNRAAEKLAVRLMAEGFECYRCRFPKGSDANQYALDVQPASKALGLVIRQAEWIGKGTPPQRGAVVPVSAETAAPVSPLVARSNALVVEATDAPPALADEAAEVCAALANEAEQIAVIEDAAELEPAPPASTLPAPPAYRVPPREPPLPVEIDAHELRLTLGDRSYAVRGIEKNLSYEQLKVWIKARCAEFVHVDTVELYQAKQRAAWIKQTATELGLSEDVIKGDLGKLLRALEARQDALIKARLQPGEERAAKAAPTLTLTPSQHSAAEALLRDPKLVERIVADVAAIGVVGEDANALVGYLACVSRKLDKPLAILIQSTSAAGKSTLMDALLSLMPEPERVHYSAMTGQSLFYLGEGDLRHKILAIAEEEGVRQAAYALKLLQSQGELTIASTGKDPTTGKLVTEEYRVEGPVMLFLTTTAIDLDDELLNRCLVLTINETREQTEAIHRRQREARTLAGLVASKQGAAIRSLHQAAQSLLRPLAVVNPYAEALTFRSESTRMRRDHAKYLTLIDSIAFLHQYQREVKTTTVAGERVEYVEVTLDDIALANRLAHEVLGRSLDELPPQTRRLLSLIVEYVSTRTTAQAIERAQLRFTRRELREAIGWGDTQLKLHLARLDEHEYVIAHRLGQSYRFELAYSGDAADAARQMVGLIDVEALRPVESAVTTANRSGLTSHRSGENSKRSGSGRPVVGGQSGTGRGDETARNANAGAELSSLVAAVEETAVPRTHAARPSHRSANGTALAARA
ncbi:MAG: CHC2 zinc finger domain-containing protein [Pseudomarimonas sp.]